MPETGLVYILLEPCDDIIRYVGQTVQEPDERLRKHLVDARRRVDSPCAVYAWLRALLAEGTRPRMRPVATVPLERLDAVEDAWITYLGGRGVPLTNTVTVHTPRRPRRKCTPTAKDLHCSPVHVQRTGVPLLQQATAKVAATQTTKDVIL